MANQENLPLGVVETTSIALQQSVIPQSLTLALPQENLDPTNVDQFSFIHVCSSDSMPLKASELSHNRPFTHFDETVIRFRKLAFNKNLEDSFSNPYYKE